MDEIFRQFARGEVPTVLEVLKALNDISDMWPGNCSLDCRAKSSQKPEEKADKIKSETNV